MTRLEHLLWILSEECSETAQRASKAARFGLDDVEPGFRQNNAERIVGEFGDIIAAIEMLAEGGHISLPDLRAAIDAKKAKVEKFLTYSAERGTLSK